MHQNKRRGYTRRRAHLEKLGITMLNARNKRPSGVHFLTKPLAQHLRDSMHQRYVRYHPQLIILTLSFSLCVCVCNKSRRISSFRLLLQTTKTNGLTAALLLQDNKISYRAQNIRKRIESIIRVGVQSEHG